MRPSYVACLVCLCGSSTLAVTIETVPVGDPGNVGEVTGAGTIFEVVVGAVPYTYRIGTYEVTNDQYVEFLNAKAATNDLGLYDREMGLSGWGGITRDGESGSYTYAAKPNMGNKPVNFVTWFGAVRFVNWLHNGQGDGDTETGAYTLLGGTLFPSNQQMVARNPGATWFLPTESEWYKAAYYDPTLNDGAGGYWDYAIGSDELPVEATANSTGDIINPGLGVANYNLGADWNGNDGNLTTVGSAGPLSTSFYGTFDQTGNVQEFHETTLSTAIGVTSPGGTRGGGWQSVNPHPAYSRPLSVSQFGLRSRGFRVATIPEPASVVLAAMGLAGLLTFGRRWRKR